MLGVVFDLSNSDASSTDLAGAMIGDIQTTIVSWMGDVISSYWGLILSISFVLFLIGFFWRMGKLKGR